MPNHASSLVSARSGPAAVSARSGPAAVSARSGPAAILAAAAMWGTTGTASTLAPAGAPPAAVGTAGLAAGGLLLLLTSRGAHKMLTACTRAQRENAAACGNSSGFTQPSRRREERSLMNL